MICRRHVPAYAPPFVWVAQAFLLAGWTLEAVAHLVNETEEVLRHWLEA